MPSSLYPAKKLIDLASNGSTSPPLEVLMMQEDELILANRLRDTMPSVVGFRLAHLGLI